MKVTKLENGMGWAMDPNAVATKDALAAMEEAFGVAPINKGEGGSIPFIPELQRIFPSAQVLVTGPEDPKANAHSPNESISLPGLKNNILAEACCSPSSASKAGNCPRFPGNRLGGIPETGMPPVCCDDAVPSVPVAGGVFFRLPAVALLVVR